MICNSEDSTRINGEVDLYSLINVTTWTSSFGLYFQQLDKTNEDIRYMSNSSQKGNGFSLVELAIVIIIIGMLSSIAIPIYYKYVDNARRTEAVASIGTIKSQISIYYATEGHYPIETIYTNVIGKTWNDIRPGELTGHYFVDNNFHYRSTDGVEFRIRCLNNNKMENNVWLDHNGDWKFEVEE